MPELPEKGVEIGNLRGNLLSIYMIRLGEVPAGVREALARIRDTGRLEALLPVFLKQGAEAIEVAVTDPDQRPC